MKFVGLAGGIGSGKSTVSARLAERGAEVIDVDLLSRELQEPGCPLFQAMVDRWGDAIVGRDGRLDRQAVARLAFADPEEFQALQAITGPPITEALVARASAHLGTEAVVVLEAATLLGKDRRLYGLSGVMVVDVPAEVALHRLVHGRGMSDEDARARMSRQPPRETRLEHADLVIDNGGPLEALDAQVVSAWTWILAQPDATPVVR